MLYFFQKNKGYEIVNIDKIPKNGPALLIFYHPLGPLDAALFVSRYFEEKNRKVICIIDRILYKVPGLKTFIETLEYEAGTIESCISILNRGDLLVIYPGGMKEVLYSDNNYKLFWRENCGFAKIALETGVVCLF